MKNHSRSSLSKFFNVMIACVFLTATVPEICAASVEAGPEVPAFQKGMCFATWEKDRFSSPYSDKALEQLKKMGVECIQINITQYQERCDSPEIRKTDLTPSDKSIKHAIKTAHKLGLNVMIKPHIDLIDKMDGTYWRADIGFQNDKDWDKWFKNYKKFITHYAKMSEKYDVEMFCVGTELVFTTQKPEYWREIIASVRKVYSGKLTYAANWDNYKNVKFWDDLDFVGIDAYFPLTYKQNPTVEDIKKGWEKWKYEIGTWSQTVKKPIVFTEIGYTSSAHAPSEPWKNGSGNPDVEMQKKCYQAFFETIWESKWLAGVYWWRWAPSIYGGGKNNRHFTPLKKPAAKLLEEKYKETKWGPGMEVPRDFGDYFEYITIEEVTSGTEDQLIDTGVQYFLGSDALIPPLKTKQQDEFRKEWKSRDQMMRSR